MVNMPNTDPVYIIDSQLLTASLHGPTKEHQTLLISMMHKIGQSLPNGATMPMWAASAGLRNSKAATLRQRFLCILPLDSAQKQK